MPEMTTGSLILGLIVILLMSVSQLSWQFKRCEANHGTYNLKTDLCELSK